MNKLYRRGTASLSTSLPDTTNLQTVDPRSWNMNDVGAYLHLIDLAEYKQNFKDNRIAGPDLLELTTDDLIRLGMTRIGHRKQLQRKILALKEESTGAFRATHVESVDASDSTSNSETSSEVSDSSGSASRSSSSRGDHAPPEEHVIRFKTVYEDRSKLLSLQRPTFDRLNKELRRKWNVKRFSLYYMDAEGDLIDIASDDDLEEVLAEAGTSSSVKIIIKPKHRRNHITTSEKDLLESQLVSPSWPLPSCFFHGTTQSNPSNRSGPRLNLISGTKTKPSQTTQPTSTPLTPQDPVLIFSKRGRLLFRNTAAAALPGNVFHLLPQLDIEAYCKTGDSPFVGKRSSMEVRLMSGAETRAVSVTETKTKTRHTFTAIIYPAKPATDVWSATYSRVTDGVLVTDSHGLIVSANAAALTTFGRPEIVGQNVKVLMQEEDALKHDGYIRNYRRSGIARVIGTGRTVVGVDAAGKLVPMHLTLIDQKLSKDERYFIGLMKVLDVDALPARTLLQAERETIEALAGAAVIIDETGTIVGINAKTEQFFGYRYIELINRNVSVLMPPDVGAKHSAYIKTYLETRKTKIIGRGRDVIARHKNGSDFPVGVYVTEKTDGEKILFTGLFSRKVSPAS
jgi:PAS domain S-box-containing protein